MREHSDIAVFVEAVDARMVEAPSLNVVALDIFGARVRKKQIDVLGEVEALGEVCRSCFKAERAIAERQRRFSIRFF